MLARQRHAYILERVTADGGVRVADLARDLGVSDMTVRRDLELLDERGLLEKVHGGATAAAGSASNDNPVSTIRNILMNASLLGLVEPQRAYLHSRRRSFSAACHNARSF